MNIPKVIDDVVKNNLCIGCGLCVYKCPSKALEMKWDENGFLIPVLTGNCDLIGDCITVCPFNPFPEKEVETENELAELFLKNATLTDPKIGKYLGVYAGYSEEFRLTSSSGGVATFILTDLLERGIVNHIFSVKESSAQGAHYEYAISNNKEELLATSKTKYYPVTLASVFLKIHELEGNVAIVGVACFIKAIRLAQFNEPALKDKIQFLVGIICGGVKSSFYTEYLSEKAGVPSKSCFKPSYRIKDFKSTAGDYSFGCYSNIDNKKKTIKMNPLGDMWGTGLFKSNACDFCDDVTTELADISLGDAWLDPFIKDGEGTNIIITRSTLAEKIITDGIKLKKIQIEQLPIKKLTSSLGGAYNHRQTGQSYRIKRILKTGYLMPPKRFDNDNKLAYDLRIIQFLRMNIRKMSLNVWRDERNALIFDRRMRSQLNLLKKITKLSHYRRAIFTKDFVKKIMRKIIR
ncbi:MAG: Coenzyme F420 hydrogenase/dehydrogenase, beta subunit C-terminal domain [Lutibacter sp.]|nr:Coenzyme F420 hydrogenase/dehydrogenase, beta subunit C-terminal domain [Lutibacter sp.]